MSDGEVVRDEHGRWVKPPKGGRPPGRSQSELVRKLIEPFRAQLVDAALELAFKSPDPHARARGIDIALSRLAPTPRQESERIEVPGLAEAIGFEAKANCILAATAGGEISVEAAERVLRLLDTLRKIVEHDQIVARLDALEAGRAATIVESHVANPEDFS